MLSVCCYSGIECSPSYTVYLKILKEIRELNLFKRSTVIHISFTMNYTYMLTMFTECHIVWCICHGVTFFGYYLQCMPIKLGIAEHLIPFTINIEYNIQK